MSERPSQAWVDAKNLKVAMAKDTTRAGFDSTGLAGGVLTPKTSPNSQKTLRLFISGQIRGGKNNMIVTRAGRHFPKPEWAKWRDKAVSEVREQLPAGFKPFDFMVNVKLTYVAGDHRRRDMPAILDSVWHVLEKAGVVTDDFHLWVTQSTRSYDKHAPRAEITMEGAVPARRSPIEI